MFQSFQFPKTLLLWFEAHPGTAGWAQAIVAGLAIVAVYIAATIPVRAEAARLERERRLRADGLALLLIPEIVVLKGEIETCIGNGSIYDTPVSVPLMLASKTDDLYLLGEPGRRLLQTIGLVNGVAAQTRRFQAIGVMHNGAPIQSRVSDGASIWANNVNSLRLGIVNLNEVLEQIESLQIS
jgi:hypothetical protein